MLYVLLCAVSLLQVSRIVVHGHRIDSFQFLFLFLCFVWTFLRALCWFVVDFLVWPMWLATALWILPSVCQISTFSLIVLYYAKLVNRTQWHQRKGFLISCYVVGNTLMVLLTIVISGLTDVESRSAATQEIENGIALLDKMFFVSSGTYFGLLLILAGFYVY